MPMFDRRCEACEKIVYDRFEQREVPDPVCECGGTLKRVWLPTANVGVIDDTWPGGKYFEHLSHKGETFYSRSEYKRFLAATGQMEFTRHVGKPGSDKSDATSRWV